MEVVPQNVFERIFVVNVIIMALVAFSSFVSSITAAMTHIRKINAQKMETESRIRLFFNEHKISHMMASRVWHYLRKNKVGAAKRLKVQDIPAFQSLPARIKEDMRMEIFTPIFAAHPLFTELARKDAPFMLKVCNDVLEERSMGISEDVFRGQKEVMEFFFIVTGVVQYNEIGLDLNKPNNGEFLQENLEKGNWACELALWAEKVKLIGAYNAIVGGTEIAALHSIKFHQTALQFQSKTFLAKYAEVFMNRFRETSRDVIEDPATLEDTNFLFNSVDLLGEILWKVNRELGQHGSQISSRASRASRVSAWSGGVNVRNTFRASSTGE
jgi:hypothetical protein